MRLSGYEQSVLDGAEGRLKQVCLENVVRYAEVLGAEELCEVTKATVYCGSHNYLEGCAADDFDEVFSRVDLARDEVVPFDRTYPDCYVQSCVCPCDAEEFEPFGQTEGFFAKNARYLDRAREAGVTIAGTCAPYLTGWLLTRGEHFVTTESSVTLMGNSLWGAMGNADGIEAAFWSAICGRTPKWGLHVDENRKGTHLVEVRADVRTPLEWDILGRAVAGSIPSGSVPVVSGRFATVVTFEKLRQFCTSLAVSSNCRLVHLVGYTPEARTVEDALRGGPPVDVLTVDRPAMENAYESVCAPGSGPVDLVSLGCPHYDIDQIKRVAHCLEGRKIHPGVLFAVWTVYPVKAMADHNGYTRVIEDAGGRIFTGTCPVTIGEVFLDRHAGFVFDSLKQAAAARSMTSGSVYLADLRSCVDAAVAGRWEEDLRWSA
jgi:predicted aconitase